MARLYRPNIKLAIRVEVAHFQCRRAGLWRARVHAKAQDTWGGQLRVLLAALREHWGLGPDDQIDLDHNPPLAARKRTGEGKATVYDPPANDPNFLEYRPHDPQFAGSHKIKTNVRGDHGQFPDRVLIKRERRRQKAEAGTATSHCGAGGASVAVVKPRPPKKKWASRKLESGRKFPKRAKR